MPVFTTLAALAGVWIGGHFTRQSTELQTKAQVINTELQVRAQLIRDGLTLQTRSDRIAYFGAIPTDLVPRRTLNRILSTLQTGAVRTYAIHFDSVATLTSLTMLAAQGQPRVVDDPHTEAFDYETRRKVLHCPGQSTITLLLDPGECARRTIVAFVRLSSRNVSREPGTNSWEVGHFHVAYRQRGKDWYWPPEAHVEFVSDAAASGHRSIGFAWQDVMLYLPDLPDDLDAINIFVGNQARVGEVFVKDLVTVVF